jgi:effector-binding domain-containing protein
MYDIEERTLTEQATVVVRGKLAPDEMPGWFPRIYAQIMAHTQSVGIYPIGPPFARYRRLNGKFEVEAGFPVPLAVQSVGVIEGSTLPGGTAAATMHVGPYDMMEPAYEALEAWVAEHGVELAGPAWEVYLTDPSVEPDPATWRTEIIQPFQSQS